MAPAYTLVHVALCALYCCCLVRSEMSGILSFMSPRHVHLLRTGWCGECYANLRGRSNVPGHVGYRAPAVPWEEPWYMLKRRARATGADQPSSPCCDGGPWEGVYPNVLLFLSQLRWEDSSPRVPGTMTLMWEDGVWKCSLRDKDGGYFCFVSGKTPTDLLEAVESGLERDTLQWRADTSQGASRKRRS